MGLVGFKDDLQYHTVKEVLITVPHAKCGTRPFQSIKLFLLSCSLAKFKSALFDFTDLNKFISGTIPD